MKRYTFEIGSIAARPGIALSFDIDADTKEEAIEAANAEMTRLEKEQGHVKVDLQGGQAIDPILSFTNFGVTERRIVAVKQL